MPAGSRQPPCAISVPDVCKDVPPTTDAGRDAGVLGSGECFFVAFTSYCWLSPCIGSVVQVSVFSTGHSKIHFPGRASHFLQVVLGATWRVRGQLLCIFRRFFFGSPCLFLFVMFPTMSAILLPMPPPYVLVLALCLCALWLLPRREIQYSVHRLDFLESSVPKQYNKGFHNVESFAHVHISAISSAS